MASFLPLHHRWTKSRAVPQTLSHASGVCTLSKRDDGAARDRKVLRGRNLGFRKTEFRVLPLPLVDWQAVPLSEERAVWVAASARTATQK